MFLKYMSDISIIEISIFFLKLSEIIIKTFVDSPFTMPITMLTSFHIQPVEMPRNVKGYKIRIIHQSREALDLRHVCTKKRVFGPNIGMVIYLAWLMVCMHGYVARRPNALSE